MESSTRSHDQNTQLHSLLNTLSADDRELVLDLVQRLCLRLQAKSAAS